MKHSMNARRDQANKALCKDTSRRCHFSQRQQSLKTQERSTTSKLTFLFKLLHFSDLQR